MKKNIISKPFGGIGNRLRVISSLLFLKEKYDCNLTIIWESNSELNAKYLDLFQLHPGFRILDALGKFKLVRTSRQKFWSKRIIAKLINKSIGIDYCVFDSDIYLGLDNVCNIIESNNVVFFNTCEEIHPFDIGLRSFKLKNDLFERLDKLIVDLKIGQETIGIHIRRTDNRIAIASSPLSLFEIVIRDELKRDPNRRFYLASDDENVLRELKGKFNESIMFFEKTFGRDSREGVVDGLLEFYILSKTKKIYGSHFSSYSELAGRISGIEVRILRINS